jgi:hypothetical protein
VFLQRSASKRPVQDSGGRAGITAQMKPLSEMPLRKLLDEIHL